MKLVLNALALLLVLVPAQPADAPVPSPDSAFSTLGLRALTDSITAAQRLLDDTRARLDQLAAKLSDLERREQSALARLNACAERIRLTSQQLRQLASQVAARNAEITRVTAGICSTAAELDARRALLARRLVSVYKYSRTLPIQIFLSTRSIPELYRRVLGLRWIGRADRQALDGLNQLSTRLDQQRGQLLVARQDLELLVEEGRRREEELKRDQADEAELLRRVRDEHITNTAVKSELEQSAQRLQAVVAELERQRAAADTSSSSGFEALKGTLPWPMAGRVVAGFGAKTHPKYKTRTTNLGLDIKPASAGAAVAVAAGQVAFADHFLGYGKLVIVDHGGGYYSLYGDLSELAVTTGAPVAVGSPVGTVTEYLHFEIRKRGQPVDPLPWLRPKSR